MQNKYPYNRKSIRIKEHDYSQKATYFITLCVKDRENILGKIKNKKIELSNIGNIVEKELIKIKTTYSNISINVYAIMPDHIHFIIEFRKQSHYNLGNIIKIFKSKTIIKTKKKIWQRNYYEHIIRNEKEYYQKYEYIINNPYKW